MEKKASMYMIIILVAFQVQAKPPDVDVKAVIEGRGLGGEGKGFELSTSFVLWVTFKSKSSYLTT